MLEYFCILSKGGRILFNFQGYPLKGSPVDSLVRSVLIEERTGESSFSFESYTLKWILANDVDLVFIAVFQKALSTQVQYVDELLSRVKDKFVDMYRPRLKAAEGDFPFKNEFASLLRKAEDRSELTRKSRVKPSSSKQVDDESDSESRQDDNNNISSSLSKLSVSTPAINPPSSPSSENDSPSSASASKLTPEEQLERLKAKIAEEKLKRASSSRQSSGPKPKTPAGPERSDTPPSKQQANNGSKKPTIWSDKGATKEEAAALDFSSSKSSRSSNKNDAILSDAQLEEKKKFYQGSGKADVADEESSDEEDNDSASSSSSQPQQQKGVFSKFFSSLVGNRVLDRADLDPVLAKFRESLMSKNVASEIAQQLCDSVAASLEGKKLPTLGSVGTEVKRAMEDALTRILTPKRSIDIAREVMSAKEQGRPYSIVFVGVNGVGKSTNLAKTCFWLQQSGFKCMIVACDTFRSGAVEQLKVHSRCLNVPVFDRGYGKDAASIAAEGINQAKKEGYDVVLVDTAGRMQDNEPLMRALSKLINVNNPDLVLFVGEALVGNDGVDQLTKFNQCLADLSDAKQPRLIDGIILTKYDTIDDKVGAALSMTHATGAPICFVGVGQTYPDLKRFSAKSVVKSLLS